MSGRKKPLSQQEKLAKLLELFHESRDVWILKDLEKTAAKEKGIVGNTVKEILDMLVSDGLVTQEKIGISNFFWSFPGAAAATKKRQREELESEVTSAKQRKVQLDSDFEAARIGREETEERSDLLVRVKEAQARLSALKTELVQFKDCDPALIDAKEKAAVIARDAANRWTDNVFCLQSYCRDRFGMDAATFCRNFQIPEEFDHIA